MSDTEAARRQAQSDFAANPMTEKKSEQQIESAELRNHYNAELERQRREAER